MTGKPPPIRTETARIFDQGPRRPAPAPSLRAGLAIGLVPLGLGLALARAWRLAGVGGYESRLDLLARLALPTLAALAFINLQSRSLRRRRPTPVLVNLAFLWLAAGETVAALAPGAGPTAPSGLMASALVALGFAVLMALGSRHAQEIAAQRRGPGRAGLLALGGGLLAPGAGLLLDGVAERAILLPLVVLPGIPLLVAAAWKLFLSHRIDREPIRLALVIGALGGAGALVMFLGAAADDVRAILFAVRATMLAAVLAPLVAVIQQDVLRLRHSLPSQVRIAFTAMTFVILLATTLVVLPAEDGRPVERQSRILVLAFVVVGCNCAAMHLATLACRRFVANVDDLVDATRKLARGKLESLVSHRGSTELAGLTGAFNAMAERVFLQTRELRILARVMDGTSDPVLVLDQDMDIAYANEAFAAKTGWFRAATIGRSYRDLVLGDEAARKLAEIEEDVRRGTSWAGELMVRTRSGEQLESFATVSPVVQDGRIVQYVAVHRDLSALKRLESERVAFADNLVRLHTVTKDLVRSLDIHEVWRRTIAGLAEHFGIAARIWVAGGGDRCGDCGLAEACSRRNRGPCLVLPGTGWRLPFDVGCAGSAARSGERVAARPQDDVFRHEPEELALAGLRLAYPLLEGGEVRGVLELGIPDAESGRLLESMNLLAEVLAQAMANARLHQQVTNQAAYLEATTRDLRNVVATQTRQAQELRDANMKLTEAERLRSNFLATTSHELRTPVSGIMGYLRLILDGIADDRAEEFEFVRGAHDLATRLLAVINDVLDLAKIDSGRMPVTIERISVRDLLMELASARGDDVREKGLGFEIAGAPESLVVHADHVRLLEVLSKLLDNAIKFSDRGRIRVRALPGAGFVSFRVEDEGIGLAPDEFERVLEPFVQAEVGDRRSYGGNGLGLSLAREQLALVGGTLHLESEGPGRGLAAVARVPIGAPVTAAEVEGDAKGGGPVVVLADSDPEFLALARSLLLARGGRLQVAATAAAAFEAVQRLHPDFVLAEYSLPHSGHPRLRSGVDLARELAAGDEPCPHFILITELAHDELPLAAALRSAPALEVARKPVDEGELLEILGLGEPAGDDLPAEFRVLLVDDDQQSSESALAALRGKRFHVDYARRGDEAIAALLQAEELYDALVIDLLLPGMSLYEILETISGRERFDALAIVVLVQNGEAVTGIQDLVSSNDLVAGAVTKSSLKAAPHVLARTIQDAAEARRPRPVRG